MSYCKAKLEKIIHDFVNIKSKNCIDIIKKKYRKVIVIKHINSMRYIKKSCLNKNN